MADVTLRNEYKRREFLQLLGSGALLTLPLHVEGAPAIVRVRMDQNGNVTALTGKVEMGQGSRTLLTQCVAEELRVPVSRITLVMGDTEIVPDDGGTWASLTTPETVPVVREAAAKLRGGDLTPPDDWKVLGSPGRSLNGRAIVTGSLAYASDLPAGPAWHAKVIRPQAYLASLISVDAALAEAMPNVKVVREGDLLAVAAPDYWTTARAAKAVKAEWKERPLPAMAAILEEFRSQAEAPVENNQTRYPPLIRRGDAAAGLASAVRKLQSSYTLAPIAHAALETRAAIATWTQDGRLTVRCGKQAPFLERAEIAKALGIAEDKVRVICSDIGGGFGSKQHADVEIEAARVARAIGQPVRIQWTREEEFVIGVARPAAVIEIESGVDPSGRLIAWRHRNYNAGAPGLKPPYDIPNQSNEFWRSPCPLRQGSYRSLAAAGNNFARESHIDEWAYELKQDPLAFRLANLTDTRLKEVIERGAQLFGWKGPQPGMGLACNLEKDARLAVFVELEAAGRQVRVRRVAGVGDFGAILNPSNLENQFLGALMQGLGGALFEKLDFDSRMQRTRRLAQYRLPRFSDLPEMKVVLIDRKEIPSAGAGEAPITLIAPAIAAALFTATGKRHRSLPLLG